MCDRRDYYQGTTFVEHLSKLVKTCGQILKCLKKAKFFLKSRNYFQKSKSTILVKKIHFLLIFLIKIFLSDNILSKIQ